MHGNISDPSLASSGRDKINWVKDHMPVMERLDDKLQQDRPFDGLTLGISIHLEAKTARLAMALRDGGAQISITSSNPLSTQDDVAAALDSEENIEVHAKRGVDEQEYAKQLEQVLRSHPDLIIDDGGDLANQLHTEHQELASGIIGGCEETTTGVNRLRALQKADKLQFPMFAVNDAHMKYLFDNRYGTGQSTWDAIMRTTNLSIAGSTVVVVGYGWCGRGIAKRASGLGAEVIVVEVDPVKAVEARMAGYRVANIRDAAPQGDFFITSTGCIDAIPREALQEIPDGSILANAGHFNVEIDVDALEDLAVDQEQVRENIERFTTSDGRDLYLLGEGRLVNLVAGDGHPVEIMDISFALQTLTAKYLFENRNSLETRVHSVPKEVDYRVAELKLETSDVDLDELTDEQDEYLTSWY